MFHLLCVASHSKLLNVFLAVLDVDASAESVEAVAYVASVYGVDASVVGLHVYLHVLDACLASHAHLHLVEEEALSAVEVDAVVAVALKLYAEVVPLASSMKKRSSIVLPK